jgi:hypothetical protein
MREKLRRALNEEKAGIRSEDSDVRLLVESEVGDAANFVVPEHVTVTDSKKKKKKGKNAQQPELEPESSDIVTEQATVSVQEDQKQEITPVAKVQVPLVVGGALKQSGDGQPAQLVKRKRTKKKVSPKSLVGQVWMLRRDRVTYGFSTSQRYRRLFVRGTGPQEQMIPIRHSIAQIQNMMP